jgi:hypothetical protein
MFGRMNESILEGTNLQRAKDSNKIKETKYASIATF